jgi:hypothetical protein
VSQYADVPAEAEQDEAADRQRDEDECGDDDQNYCCADQGFLAVSSGFGDQVDVVPAWWVDEGVTVSLAA